MVIGLTFCVCISKVFIRNADMQIIRFKSLAIHYSPLTNSLIHSFAN